MKPMTVKIMLKGSPEEIGRQRAKELRSSILFSMQHLMIGHGRETAQCVAWGRKWKADVAKKFPVLMAEIEAESGELGLDGDLVFAYNYRSWNAMTRHSSHPLACYNIFFLDRVRGPLLGGVVEDGPPFYLVEEIRPEKGIAHFSVTLAGTCWTVRGFNAEGLAVGQVSAFPGDYCREGAIYRWGTEDYSRGYYILRTALQTMATAREAAAFCAKHDALGTFMFVDKKGEAIVVEKAGRLTAVRTCKKDVMVSGGHYCEDLVRELLKEGVVPLPPAASLVRQRAVFRMTAKQKPTLSLMKRILTSHREEEGTFCSDGNQMITIGVPAEGKFLVAGYIPCKSGFTEYTLK